MFEWSRETASELETVPEFKTALHFNKLYGLYMPRVWSLNVTRTVAPLCTHISEYLQDADVYFLYFGSKKLILESKGREVQL